MTLTTASVRPLHAHPQCRAASLEKLDLPATDENARAMLRALGKAEDASIAYGEFRRFAILMPRDKLMSDREPNLAWFESATCLPIGGATGLPHCWLCCGPYVADFLPPPCMLSLLQADTQQLSPAGLCSMRPRPR